MQMESLGKAIKAIEGQQGKERTAVWMVGEQLKDILQNEPEKAELVWQDLVHGGMKLSECEKRIKALADKHKTGNFACVTPAEAEEIIREYFGIGKDERDEASVFSLQSSEDGGDPSGASRQLPSAEGRQCGGRENTRPAQTEKKRKIIDLEDFF